MSTNKLSKPRLGESPEEVWKNIHIQAAYWWKLGYYIELDTLGEGRYSLDKDNKIIRMYGTPKLPTYEVVKDFRALDKAIATDTCEITARRMGTSGDGWDNVVGSAFWIPRTLHSCSGMSYKSKEQFISEGWS